MNVHNILTDGVNSMSCFILYVKLVIQKKTDRICSQKTRMVAKTNATTIMRPIRIALLSSIVFNLKRTMGKGSVEITRKIG